MPGKWLRWALALLCITSCGPSLQSDLGRIRADIQDLERRLPGDDLPLWITEETVRNNPALTEADIFDRLVQDHTASIPDTLYYHVLGKLRKMSDEQIAALSSGNLSYAQILKRPADFRGKLLRVTGTIGAFQVERIADPESPVAEIYSGICLAGDGEPILFHVIEKPDVLHLNEDTVELTGLFVKIVGIQSGGRRLSAPLLLARSLRKYL